MKGRSVPLLTHTSYCNGESCCLSFALSNFSTALNAFSDGLRFLVSAVSADLRIVDLNPRPQRKR